MAELARIGHDWVELAKRIQAFVRAKFFRAVKNPETNKRFTRAADWVRFVTGQCPSAFCRDQQILRELEGLVPETDLKEMSRENAKQLVQHNMEFSPPARLRAWPLLFLAMPAHGQRSVSGYLKLGAKILARAF
ncbi:MAG TPA: hypothetical protein VH437_18240 [Terriglobales bacterium]